MVFLTFRSDRLLQNYEITLKVSGNPERFSKKSEPRKSWQKSYLMVEMH